MTGWRLWKAAGAAGLALAANCFALSAAMAAGIPESPAQLRAARHTAAQFEDLAGSPRNAWALVQGLRWGTAITLSAARPVPQRVSFTSPAHRMGYGNIARALAIARNEFAARRVRRPSPAQLETLLLGGTLRTGTGAAARLVRTPGILPLRAVHLGWGQIAHALAISPASRVSAHASL